MKHPKPWKVTRADGGGVWVKDDEGNHIPGLGVKLEPTTALEIVAAVNSREKLVEAAKELIRVVDSDSVEPVEMARCRFDDLREALSEGGGQ